MNLKPFCADYGLEIADYLAEPFVVRGWRYASDGRIAVREPAPGEPDTPWQENPHDCRGNRFHTCARIFLDHDWSGCTVGWPHHGGQVSKERYECPGGELCIVCAGDEVNDEGEPCHHCDGLGTVHKDCLACGGEGWIDTYEEIPLAIGEAVFSGYYLVLVERHLPGARLEVPTQLDRPLRFVSGAVQGLLSPRRTPRRYR